MRRLFQFPWRSRRQIRADVDDELRFHIEARADELVAREGLARAAALARARDEFGDVHEARRSLNQLDVASEAARRRKDYLGAFWQDTLYALRTLRSAPGFSLAVVLTLALGIGASTAIVSVAYGVLLRPLPYRDPGLLVVISAERTFGGQVRSANYSALELAGWQQRETAFTSIGMWGSTTYRLRSETGTQTIGAAFVSDQFFSTLGEGLALGRSIGAPDAGSGVAVISDGLWRHEYGSDARILGRMITLNGHPYSVIGVTRPDFTFPSERIDAWTPLAYAQKLGEESWANNGQGGGFNLIARLRPGTTLRTARESAENVARSLVAEFPQMSAGRRPLVFGLVPWFTDKARPALLMLVAAVGLVLVVACANAMNLLLARQATRAHELSIRAALGASPARLMSSALLESALLSLLGGLLGVGLAIAGVRAFVAMWPASLPRADAIHVDRPILAFALLLSLGAAFVCGLAPAVRCLRYRLATGPRPDGLTQSRAARRFRSGLVVAQLAASLILLVGASLLGRSFVRLLHADVGIRLDDVVVAEMNLGVGRTMPAARQIEVVEGVLERVAVVPGVRRASVATSLPLSGPRLRYTLKEVMGPEGRPRDYDVEALAITPAFFSTLAVPLVQGRFFTDADTKASPPVMIMSARTARAFFGDRDPIGRTLSLPAQGPSGHEDVTLVGVVGDIKYKTLDAQADGGVYRPFRQQPWSFAYLVVQTSNDPVAVVGALRKSVAQVDAEIALDGVRSLGEVMSSAVSEPRFRTVLLVALATLALVLASIGLYGAMSYSVSVRTTELGIRMALGAGADTVTAMVVRQGLQLACMGAVIGVLGALALTRVVRGLLYGVEPTDAVSFVIAPIGLLMVAVVATFIPARRAASVDPIVALRSD